MKTVRVHRHYDYRPRRGVTIAYQAGRTYGRVPEAAVRAMLEAGVAHIVAGVEHPPRPQCYCVHGGVEITGSWPDCR